MPMPDVLSTVGNKTGRFTVWNTSSQHYYELHIDKGLLTALMVNNEPVEDIFPLRNRMAELVNLKSGEFEFENLASRLLVSHHQLSIDTLLLSGLAVADEVAEHRPHLPNPQTVFKTHGNKEPWLTGDLLDFWHCSGALLKQGASAEAIAKETALYPDHVLLCLYKLRMAGVITPLRAFQYDSAFPSLPGDSTNGLPGSSPLLDLDKYLERSAAGAPVTRPDSRPLVQEPGIIQRIMHRLWRGFSGQS